MVLSLVLASIEDHAAIGEPVFLLDVHCGMISTQTRSADVARKNRVTLR
jgi:hypothetical protein